MRTYRFVKQSAGGEDAKVITINSEGDARRYTKKSKKKKSAPQLLQWEAELAAALCGALGDATLSEIKVQPAVLLDSLHSAINNS